MKIGLKSGMHGPDVEQLQTILSGDGYEISRAEVEAHQFGPSTLAALQAFQKKQGIRPTKQINKATLDALNKVGKKTATNVNNARILPPVPKPIAVPATVTGQLAMDYGAPATGVTVRLYSVGYNGTATKLAETKSNDAGAYSLTYRPPNAGANVQVRVVDANGKEIAVSSVTYNAPLQKVMDLIVPASVQPLASEFQRLSADVQSVIGGKGIQNLGTAKEDANQQDLTLLCQSTGWDARLLAIAALAAQQSAASGLGADMLYALFRCGLPTDPYQLALVPAASVTAAFNKANQSGIINYTDSQISAATTAFQAYANKTQLGSMAPGGVSSFGDLFKNAGLTDPTMSAGFMNLVSGHAQPADDFWQDAAALKIPTQTLNALKTQGKCFYLTLNNLPLTQRILQDIGPGGDLSQLAEKDYYDSATWKTVINDLAKTNKSGSLAGLIPSGYASGGNNGLEAYAADLARKVRLSFPTQTTARLLEKGNLSQGKSPLKSSPTAVAAFLRSAAAQGFELGRTPLSSFLNKSGDRLQPLNTDDMDSLKTLYRMYQVTPSDESLEAALSLGFKSANEIASNTRTEFMAKYGGAFPSYSEADLVFRKSQQVSSVTFNFFAMAKQLDTSPPFYALSSSPQAVQDARNSIIEQFPSMQTLFGSMDFCQCEDCRSVLSPAAYFVDLLEFLGNSNANAAGYTPLDVLIGSQNGNLTGRRADLAALPLTCENTNTAMPYIDIVNEILEYYVCNNALDAGVAYDTGDVTTDDLTAEPQNVLPQAYGILMKANSNFGFPLGLPFDLWLETVRGFYRYFKTPLGGVLDVLRPMDKLELFTDAANPEPYYRASIFAEALGLSPSDYALFTDPNALQTWYSLYSYPTEAMALNGGTYPATPPNFSYTSLSSAKCLAQYSGLTYQELTDLVTTGFLNPALAAISFQFRRFGIDMDLAFSYTGQPGFPSWSAIDSDQQTSFLNDLDAVTQKYKSLDPSSTFDAKTWLQNVLPANYSKKVLVLHDADSGCNFSTTTLAYADGSPATGLDFLRLNLFVRLWKKSGWTMDELDQALQMFFAAGSGGLPATTDPTFGPAFSSAWATALVYMAHLDNLASQWQPTLGRAALLPLWAPLTTTGNNPLYARIFLTPSVLNSDPAFDDPPGQFPGSSSDPLSQHQPGIQGALGLSSNDISAILDDAGTAVTTVTVTVNGQNVQVPSFSLANLSILYRYNMMATGLNLDVEDFIALKGLAVDMYGPGSGVAGLNPFAPPSADPLKVIKDDLLFIQTLQFVQEAGVVAGSGFTVEDVRYLLLHQYDPVGKYRQDENALMTLVQVLATGLEQIKNKNSVPADLTGMSDDLIQQRLSSLFPVQLLDNVVGLLTNTTGFTASQSVVAPGNQIDPSAYTDYPELSLNYDQVLRMQTLVYKGALLDWKKNLLLGIDPTATYAALLTALLNQVQQENKPAFDNMVENLLGVWASLVQYEATRSVTSPIVFTNPPADPALEVGYDADNKIQWATYRGVLTAAKLGALTAVNTSADFAALLTDLQNQPLSDFNELLGFLLGLWANMQSYQAVQTNVSASNQIDSSLFASYPQIQFSYDPNNQAQTMTIQGVLTTAVQSAASALIPTANPASPILDNLLQTVRSQAMAFVQAQAANWVTITTPAEWDSYLDNNSQPYLGLDSSKKLRLVKGELVKVFSPLLAKKLSKDLIVQALSSALSSDPSLTAALATDPGLLPDPSNPGRSLLGSLAGPGQAGITATYYASADQSGTPLGSGPVTATMASTTDPGNPDPTAVASVHFEGYLQVQSDGPYRFFGDLANTGAHIRFQVDAPPSAPLVDSPVMDYSAVKSADETSQFVELQGGVAYHFTVDFTSLGTGGGAGLLIQGENLPKGPLSQIRLYPQSVVDDFSRARILLSKALQLIEGMGLDQTEVSYFVSKPDQFNGFKLANLPSKPIEDPPSVAAAKAETLFAQFLTLADYADLKRGPAGGSDALISVFQNVGATFTESINSAASNNNQSTPWTILGNLTRRDPEVVRDVALYFGLIQETTVGGNLQLTAVGDFANNRGIRRIWEALKVIQILGLPVAAVTDSTKIVSPSRLTTTPDPGYGTALNLRNAVKSQYQEDTWRKVAQSVFDPLRQKKRDALVAYVVRDLLLENEEQLFEYFLVDPGMEPIVQTSRLRLALSSVQTFIQRCLLNLESGHTDNPNLNIVPSAIDADWWSWMKRYRVWEANREIFLYPENWMEPELRLDKTDLFQSLESTLLQGDVTNELVENAFYKYLKGLETRARLDIVATYLDQTGPMDATDDTYPDYTLHVVGRTYGQPHQYFYRTYSDGVWTPWVPVTTAIDGDHIAVVVWRNKVNLFWVTFQPITASSGTQPANAGSSASGMKFGTLASSIASLAAQKQVQVQLNWSEYFQGKWSDRMCSDVNQYEPVDVPDQFNPGDVYIHVTKEPQDAYGNDGPVLIHLDIPVAQAVYVNPGAGYQDDPDSAEYSIQIVPVTYSFRITSRNCNPDFGTKYAKPAPENPYAAKIPDATQYLGLETLEVDFKSEITDGMGKETPQTILQKTNNYALLLCSNPVAPPFLIPTLTPDYAEAGALVAPFFFKDINIASGTLQTTDELTFFVQPSLTEKTIVEWNGYTIGNPVVNPAISGGGYWKNLPVVAQVPTKQRIPINPGDPASTGAIYQFKNTTDWLTASTTAVGFGKAIVTQGGGVTSVVQNVGNAVSVGVAGSVPGGLNFVGGQGLSGAALRNILAGQTIAGGTAVQGISTKTKLIS